MADYYPLIARAVAGLEKNTGDARRALYERARTALVAQLRSVNPPLSENDVTRERLALEESIRKVEAEAARKAWVDPPTATTRVRAPEFPRWDPPPPATASDEDLRHQPAAREDAGFERPPARAPRAPQSPPAAAAGSMLGEQRYVDPVFDQPLPSEQAPVAPPRVTTARQQRAPAGNRSLLDSGLKDFREVVSESDELGEAPARAARAARENLAAVPSSSHDYDRLDARPHDPGPPTLPEYQAPAMLEQGHDYDDPRPAPAKGRGAAVEREAAPRRSLRDAVKIIANIVILALLGALLGWQWPNIVSIYRSIRAPTTEVARAPVSQAPQSTPRKTTDRLEQGTGLPSAPQASAPTQASAPSADTAPAAAVAQKVVLYEEDPNDPQGKRFVGSAIWRTERVSPGPGQPVEIAIRADVEIPDRKLAMTWSLRRNTDQSLPASHTVEIMFRLPQDFPAGGVSNVPGILMKASEQTRGVPLAGLAVKVTNGFFLIGLSAADADRERNVQMLKERQWFDIPVVYNNNRRAILAVEKGTPGERVFQEAFSAWRQ